MTDSVDIAVQFEKHLSSPKQTWLLGAGISVGANIPLMGPLTDRVLDVARSEVFNEEEDARGIIDFLQGDVPESANIENILTHLCDFISMADRSRSGTVLIDHQAVPSARLIEIHKALLATISDVIQWGYRPATIGEHDRAEAQAIIGTPTTPIVRVEDHLAFVNAIFGATLAGLEGIRSPVEFFTTNYDTLLEDALALNKISYQDGFAGGGVAFWNKENYGIRPLTRAIVTKLHGSIDWYHQLGDPSQLFRVRRYDTYPDAGGGVMIYPQAIKYLDAQRDPFAALFQRFRNRLEAGKDQVLLVCGYSFSDEHINAEIENALAAPRSQLTIVAFCEERAGILPDTLERWRFQHGWGEQVFIASQRGLYQGKMGPVFARENGNRSWWTFGGVTELLAQGFPLDVTELTRSHSGRVYDVGQIGSILKVHLGRRIIFATVRMLRLQSDEETAALSTSGGQIPNTQERRVIEADLLGEGWYSVSDEKLSFARGVSTYPLPLQAVHLITKGETEQLFQSVEDAGDEGVRKHVPIGTYVGATRVQCRANIDKLFGQHCAVLGSTGSGKSSAVSAIIHSVLEHQAREGVLTRPTIILIDPHGEYAHAFRERAIVYRAYDALGQDELENANLALPYWLMSGDEFRSLIVGKTEFEATSQANTVYKALTHARLVEAGLARSAMGDIPVELLEGRHPEEPIPCEGVAVEDILGFDRDKPRPFKLAEFRQHIVGRQAKRLTNNGWTDVTASEFQRDYSSILNKFRVLTTDSRVRFLMREYNEGGPDLPEILAQLLNLRNGELPCLKIVDISGLPNEVAGPLTGAIARLVFQYKVHETREERETDPILFICEEAHRYVPNRGDAQYEVAQSAIRRLAREGRKYGLGLMLVSQRPSDIEGTVISQCNSWVVLRLSNSADQEHVAKFLPDSLVGMTKMVSSLPRQEALFVGEASAIPTRIRLRTLTPDQLPDSNDVSFALGWASGGIDLAGLERIAYRMT